MQFEIHIKNVEIDWACDLKNKFRKNNLLVDIDIGKGYQHGRPYRFENPNQYEFWNVVRIFGTGFSGSVRGPDCGT